MLGQDSIIEEITLGIEGLIQSRIGAFLQLKAKLQEMSRSPVLTISDEAKKLFTIQLELEAQLPSAIEKSKGSASDILSASTFFVMIEKQKYDVDNLIEEYQGLGESAKPTLISGVPNWVLYIAGGLVALKLIRR